MVPGSLRTEEFPSGLVCAKLLLLLTSESGAFPLFVRVGARLFCATSCESLETCRMHQTHFLELLDAFDVNGAPGAGGPARSEANGVAGFVDALSNAVDPSEAESGVYGFRPNDAGLCGTFFVEANEEFWEFVVMGFEPGTEVMWRGKECRFWPHGVQPDVGGHRDPTVVWQCLDILHGWLRERRVKRRDTEGAEKRKRTDRNVRPTRT